MVQKIRVTVWNEFIHEKKNEAVKRIYPHGMHEAIARGLQAAADLEVRTATLDQPQHGLTEAVLDRTDVLTWWGHVAHGQVAEDIVDRVHKRVLEGMGLIFISWFEGGEVFRSGCCWERGHGRIFYFRPGHETFPIYHDKNVATVLTNAVRWAKPRVRIADKCPNVPVSLEKISSSAEGFGKAGVVQNG